MSNQDPAAAVIRSTRYAFVSVAAFSFFINALMLAFPLYIIQVFSRVMTSRSNETLIMLIIITMGAFLVMALLEIVRSRVLTRVSARLETALSGDALEASLQTALAGGGHSVQALRDLGAVRNFFTGAGVFPLLDAPWSPVFLLVIYLFHPILGIVAIAGAFALFLFAIINDLATRRPLNEANAANSQAMRLSEAAVRNADVVEGMGMRRGLIERWWASNSLALALQIKASTRTSTIRSLAKFVRFGVQVGIFGGGAYLTIIGELIPGAMFAAILLMSRALSPVEAIIGTWREFINARGAYKRLRVAIRGLEDRHVSLSLPTPKGQLSVERLVYFPPQSEVATLRGINFALDPGEILGVIGPTASGKSTLARLLVGSWKPGSGDVRLDGAEVYSWQREDFGAHVGYLPQDVELFSGTVRDNIARFGDASDQEVIKAAQFAGVHDMILRLPMGYETEIGEGGEKLSGGQRQRIGLARAFLGPPVVLVLDEPNANLDTDGELALITALENARELGITVVLIAHRPNILEVADKIMILQNGMVAAFGDRETVLAKAARPGTLKQVRQQRRLASSDAPSLSWPPKSGD